jgi:putative oxidoreductase
MSARNSVAAFFTSGPGRWLLLAARVVVGGVFVYAAYSKLHFDGRWHLGDYQFLFALAIDSYKMLPLGLVQWMARVLPWLEIVLGALLILGVALRWVSSAVSALFVVFMIALTRATILGLEINCGCFGYGSVKPSTELLHDSSFLLLALFVTAGAFLSRRTQDAVA